MNIFKRYIVDPYYYQSLMLLRAIYGPSTYSLAPRSSASSVVRSTSALSAPSISSFGSGSTDTINLSEASPEIELGCLLTAETQPARRYRVVVLSGRSQRCYDRRCAVLPVVLQQTAPPLGLDPPVRAILTLVHLVPGEAPEVRQQARGNERLRRGAVPSFCTMIGVSY